MPKATADNLQALLAPYGLKLIVVDGKLSIREGVGSDLPPRKATLVFVAKMKPDGSVGRGGTDGYNLQAAMALSDEHYTVLQDIGKLILQRTQSIDINLSLTKQKPGSIQLCIKKLLKVHPELHAYKPFGYWALRATFQLLLRNKSGQANTLARELKKIEEMVKSGEELPKPATKSHRQRGRPRKNPQPTVPPQSAPEPTKSTQPPLEPTAPSHPPLKPGPVAVAPQDDSGEVFDLNIEDETDDEMDISIHQAIQELSRISISADDSDNDGVDDEGGSFDMTQVTAAPASSPASNPTLVSTVSVAPPVPVVPAVHAKTLVHPTPLADTPPLLSGAPTASSMCPNPTPTTTTATSGSGSDSILWRGLVLTSDDMTKFRSIAVRRAAGKKPRYAKIYDDLIEKLITDPNYDPSSESNPPTAPGLTRGGAVNSVTSTTTVTVQVTTEKATVKPKPKVKATSAAKHNLNPSPISNNERVGSDEATQMDSGKAADKGGAIDKVTNTLVRRSGRNPKQVKR